MRTLLAPRAAAISPPAHCGATATACLLLMRGLGSREELSPWVWGPGQGSSQPGCAQCALKTCLLAHPSANQSRQCPALHFLGQCLCPRCGPQGCPRHRGKGSAQSLSGCTARAPVCMAWQAWAVSCSSSQSALLSLQDHPPAGALTCTAVTSQPAWLRELGGDQDLPAGHEPLRPG